MKRVAIFTSLYPPASRGGGPIRSTEAMIEAAPLDVMPIVITNDHDLGEQVPLEVNANVWARHGRTDIRYTTASSFIELFRGFSAVKQKQPDLLHFNSFFAPKFTILPLLLWRFGYWGRVTLLVAPRGEFGAGAMGRRNMKKRLYISLFRLLGIHRSVIWHSTAAHESEDIRRVWGKKSKIIVRENHTLLPIEPQTSSMKPRQEFHFVFLGRIVEHKGLAVILKALKGVLTSLTLDIYGPEEDAEYTAQCRNLVTELPENISVTFRGTVAPNQVREVLSTYDALLMPTAGENFGHVIAESLSVSCPVFTTPYTPWTEILQSGGGIVVENREPESWADAVEHFVAQTPESREQHRKMTGNAYKKWRAQPEKPHVWTLVLQSDGRKR